MQISFNISSNSWCSHSRHRRVAVTTTRRDVPVNVPVERNIKDMAATQLLNPKPFNRRTASPNNTHNLRLQNAKHKNYQEMCNLHSITQHLK